MKIKVGLFSSNVVARFTRVIAALSAIATFLLISVDVPDDRRVFIAVVTAAFIVITYLLIWLLANFQNSKKLLINNSILEIKVGDLFEQKGLKVISFNEYFDTAADDILISKNSLNGIYLSSLDSTIIANLDNRIENDRHLNDNKARLHTNRVDGKKQAYKLGTIFTDNDYLLVAFTKFDDNNKAYLYLKEYVACLLKFWEEIDRVYAGRSVSLPLMGSGITRIKDTEMQPQEILNILIWTYKISKVKFKHPSKATIVIHESLKDKINLSNLGA